MSAARPASFQSAFDLLRIILFAFRIQPAQILWRAIDIPDRNTHVYLMSQINLYCCPRAVGRALLPVTARDGQKCPSLRQIFNLPFSSVAFFNKLLLLYRVSRMIQPFDAVVLTNHVAVSAGSLVDNFCPFVLAQANEPQATADFLPALWIKLRSSVDLNSVTDFALRHGPKVVTAIVVFVVGRMLARFLSGMLVRASKKARVDQTLMGFIGNVAYVLMLCAVCIASLSCLGVDTTSLTAVLAAAGFAVGMALQGTLGNFASGALLVFFKPFRVGDMIEVGGVSGNVVEVQIFNTILTTPDNVRIIVPNLTITGATIRNLSAEPQRRIDLVIGSSYHDDLRAVRRFLEEVVQSDPRILTKPAPVVAVSELGDSSVNFVVRPWVLSSNYHAVKFHLIEQIKLGFDERGLTIPFPSRDVFVHHSLGQQATLPFDANGQISAAA